MPIPRADLARELSDSLDVALESVTEGVDVYANQLEAPAGDLSDDNAAHIRRAFAAELDSAGHAPLDAVIAATAAKSRADQDAEAADLTWRKAIRDAVAAGERVVEIAAAAGVTRDRVYQIRDGRR